MPKLLFLAALAALGVALVAALTGLTTLRIHAVMACAGLIVLSALATAWREL